MPLFVHLTPQANAKAILRSGISRLRKPAGLPSGVYAMPVMKDFYASHQWLRELRRRGHRNLVGVYFRVNDDEPVWVGHYNQAHTQMNAAEAVALLMSADDPLGFEVIIPRRVRPGEIHKIRNLPHVVGWRYYPGAKGRKPCGCPVCQRGLYGGRKLREKYAESFADPWKDYLEDTDEES